MCHCEIIHAIIPHWNIVRLNNIVHNVSSLDELKSAAPSKELTIGCAGISSNKTEISLAGTGMSSSGQGSHWNKFKTNCFMRKILDNSMSLDEESSARISVTGPL